MNQNKINEIWTDYKKSLERLNESLHEDLSVSSSILDGTIQRFEFCFELAWKLMKAVLQYKGIEVNSPRAAIKEAYRNNIIQDGDGWIKMLDDRNLTSHTYDEELAKEIYKKIKQFHFKLLQDLVKELSNHN